MCEKYKYEGFLYNEELRNINPFYNKLTKFQKHLILLECRLNFRYFINTIIFKGKKESLLYKIYVNLFEENLK